MAATDTKTRTHPAWRRRNMPADVRALGKYGEFIASAIRQSDHARRSVKKREK